MTIAFTASPAIWFITPVVLVHSTTALSKLSLRFITPVVLVHSTTARSKISSPTGLMRFVLSLIERVRSVTLKCDSLYFLEQSGKNAEVYTNAALSSPSPQLPPHVRKHGQLACIQAGDMTPY